MTYAVKASKSASTANGDYIPRGGALEVLYNQSPEIIIEGPAETGKTMACCWKSHVWCLKYPGATGAIVRKQQTDIYGSVLETFKDVTEGAPLNYYGGESPSKIIYPNGSVIWIAGLDKSSKVLSSERDFIYVNQAEELSKDNWESLSTRTTGRGAVMPYTQLLGDVNPGPSKHWILKRAKQGPLKLIKSKHVDNPTLYDDGGSLTSQGVRTMATLEALTGVRRKRLLDGIWATAEGAVYDMFDSEIHVKRRPSAEMKRWFVLIDEGYTNPCAILLVGMDSDDRGHVYREFYERGKLQAQIVSQAAKYALLKPLDDIIVDGSAAGLIADLRDAGLDATGVKGRVIDSIHLVQDRLAVQDDGLPRLTVDPNCVETINEFESYVWKPNKDEPVKEHDHTMDDIRYWFIHVDRLLRRKKKKARSFQG